jgi:hypothetical protein
MNLHTHRNLMAEEVRQKYNAAPDLQGLAVLPLCRPIVLPPEAAAKIVDPDDPTGVPFQLPSTFLLLRLNYDGHVMLDILERRRSRGIMLRPHHPDDPHLVDAGRGGLLEERCGEEAVIELDRCHNPDLEVVKCARRGGGSRAWDTREFWSWRFGSRDQAAKLLHPEDSSIVEISRRRPVEGLQMQRGVQVMLPAHVMHMSGLQGCSRGFELARFCCPLLCPFWRYSCPF